jgi:hypothetical protein
VAVRWLVSGPDSTCESVLGWLSSTSNRRISQHCLKRYSMCVCVCVCVCLCFFFFVCALSSRATMIVNVHLSVRSCVQVCVRANQGTCVHICVCSVTSRNPPALDQPFIICYEQILGQIVFPQCLSFFSLYSVNMQVYVHARHTCHICT